MDILSYKLGKGASGGGGADLDWSAIGFDTRPSAIDEGYNYAKQIALNWSPGGAGAFPGIYSSDKKLVFFPYVDLANTSITNMKQAFQNCYSLIAVATLDTSKIENMNGVFYYCYSIKDVPLFDTSNVIDFRNMFGYCYSLITIPVYNTTKATDMRAMFANCQNLSNTSLNNILQMCINATKISASNKTLASIGLSSAQATICQSLSNYNDFISAGWTTGY